MKRNISILSDHISQGKLKNMRFLARWFNYHELRLGTQRSDLSMRDELWVWTVGKRPWFLRDLRFALSAAQFGSCNYLYIYGNKKVLRYILRNSLQMIDQGLLDFQNTVVIEIHRTDHTDKNSFGPKSVLWWSNSSQLMAKFSLKAKISLMAKPSLLTKLSALSVQ